jgi:hypothetical protein
MGTGIAMRLKEVYLLRESDYVYFDLRRTRVFYNGSPMRVTRWIGVLHDATER